MCHDAGVVASIPQTLRQLGKFSSSCFGKLLPSNARTQALRVRKDPLQLLPNVRIAEILKRKLVDLRNAVRPIRMDAKPVQITNHKQRRILQRKGVLLKLGERRV